MNIFCVSILLTATLAVVYGQSISGGNHRGSYNLNLNPQTTKNTGPQLTAGLQKNLYVNDNKGVKLTAGGQFTVQDGRRPNHNINAALTKTLNGDRGAVSIGVNKNRGGKPQFTADARANLYNNGNLRLDAGGQLLATRGGKPTYGSNVQLSGNLPKDIGTWGVGVNKYKGSGPQLNLEAKTNLWTSKDKNWGLDLSGKVNAQRGGRPDVGGMLQLNGRVGRSVDMEYVPFEQEEVLGNEEQ